MIEVTKHDAAILGIGIAIAGIAMAYKWDGHISEGADCIFLQEMGGVIFQVDSCQGEVVEIGRVKAEEKE